MEAKSREVVVPKRYFLIDRTARCFTGSPGTCLIWLLEVGERTARGPRLRSSATLPNLGIAAWPKSPVRFFHPSDEMARHSTPCHCNKATTWGSSVTHSPLDMLKRYHFICTPSITDYYPPQYPTPDTINDPDWNPFLSISWKTRSRVRRFSYVSVSVLLAR